MSKTKNIGTEEFTAYHQSKIKLELDYDDIMKRSKVFPGGKARLNEVRQMLLLGEALPNNKLKRFLDRDLSLTDAVRLAHKFGEIKALPSVISDKNLPYMDVEMTSEQVVMKTEFDITPQTLYHSDFARTDANTAAFSLLNKMGFVFWWENSLLEMVANEDYDTDDEEVINTKKTAKKWQRQTAIVKAIKKLPNYDVLYKALSNQKLEPQLRIWYAMLLFIDSLNISIADLAYRDEEDGECVYIDDTLQIHLDYDSVSESIEAFRNGDYSWIRGITYSRIYRYEEDLNEVNMCFDNTDLFHWQVHEFIEMIFHFKNWFWINPKKEYRNGYLNSLKQCVQIMQSHLRIPIEFAGFDLCGDFECCKRKILRLQDAYYTRRTENDEKPNNISDKAIYI